MKIYKEETHTVVVEDECLCDRCGQPVEPPDESYLEYDFDLSLRTGYHFPEDDMTTTQALDLCQPCVEILLTLMKENGFNLHEVEKYPRPTV